LGLGGTLLLLLRLLLRLRLELRLSLLRLALWLLLRLLSCRLRHHLLGLGSLRLLLLLLSLRIWSRSGLRGPVSNRGSWLARVCLLRIPWLVLSIRIGIDIWLLLALRVNSLSTLGICGCRGREGVVAGLSIYIRVPAKGVGCTRLRARITRLRVARGVIDCERKRG
jgi:hypothetical protein